MKMFISAWIVLLCITLQAWAGDNPVSARLVQYHVKPAYQAKFHKALRAYVFSSLKAAGNIMAEACFEEKDSSILWLVERWSSRSALDKQGKTNAVKAIATLMEHGLVSPADTIFIEDLEPLPAKAYRKKPATKDHSFTILLFVDAKEGTENDFKTIYHTAMPAFRSEAGVITYQLSQVLTDKTKFVTYEKFRNEEAFQYHLKFPPIEPVIHYLRTSIKVQPFESGLHRLIALGPLFPEP